MTIDAVFTNKPFGGLRMAASKQQQQGVETLWSRFGQDPNTSPIPGVCGLAVLDADGNAIPFFRYYSGNDHAVFD